MRSTIVFILISCVCIVAGGQSKPAQQQAKPQAQDPDAAIQAQIQQAAKATINWESSSTPGAKAEVKLLRQDQAEGRPVFQYHLKITGAPRNKLYNLIAWPITMPEAGTIMEGLAIAADGTVGCPPNSDRSCAQRFKGAELKLTYTPAIGEIYRHALISEDHQTRIFFTLVPAPMIEHDRACSLEVVRLSPRFELALIRGRGFIPGEQPTFHSQSYQDAHDSQPKVDSNGQFWAVLTPFVKGRTTGTMDVSVRAKSCSPSLAFQWGAQ